MACFDPEDWSWVYNKTEYGLVLQDNNLKGTTPSQLGLLTGVQLVLNDHLSGSIPSELGTMTGFDTFWLYSNQLCDDIPSEVSALSSVGAFNSDLGIRTGNSLGTSCISPTPQPTGGPSSSSGGLGASAITEIVVGAVAACGILVVACLYWRKIGAFLAGKKPEIPDGQPTARNFGALWITLQS